MDFNFIFTHVTKSASVFIGHLAYRCPGIEGSEQNPTFYITSFGLDISTIFILTTIEGILAAQLFVDKSAYLFGLALGGILSEKLSRKKLFLIFRFEFLSLWKEIKCIFRYVY